MIIDLTKVLDTVKASKPSTPKKRKAKKTKQVEAVTLGDINRLADLPDVVSIEFLAGYSDNLDELLYPYVATRQMSIGYASNYKDVIINNIFGNEHHLGIFHYLQERNTENLTDKELVSHAERMLVKGWHIRQEGIQYWLVNMDFAKIIELTGKAPLAREIAALVFDESSAHIFLDDNIAAKFSALAQTLGHDADELAASGNLDVLLTRVTDNKFGGYILNYTAWRNILKKQTRYPTLTDGITPLDLYEQGYRLDSQLTYPVGEKSVFMDNKNDRFLILPVLPEVSLETGVNKYQLACIASNIKQELFSTLKGVIVQNLTEIKELKYTFAVMLDYWDAPATDVTMTDTASLLRRIQALTDSGSLPNSFSQRVLETVAAILVTEAILLGDATASLGCLNVDSISGNVYSYNSLEYFTREIATVTPSSEPLTLADIPLIMNNEALGKLIPLLPKSFLSKLANYEVNIEEYPGEFNKIKEYFSRAKALILQEGN